MPLDANDLAQLYDRHAAELLAFFVRRTFEPEVAVDLLAETFAAAFTDRSQFRGQADGTARSWLFAVGRRRLLDFYRRGYIERRALTRLGVERRGLTDSEYDRIEDLAASRALREAIGEAFGSPRAAERDVLRLRIVEERTYREVANELGISEQTARARASRALRTLRQSTALARVTEAPENV
jgi:RNA polymerase sigma-70 factor (ECF subfamily)